MESSLARWRSCSALKSFGFRKRAPDKSCGAQSCRKASSANHQRSTTSRKGTTVHELYERYREERMPTHASTIRGYTCWFKNHILPAWGQTPLNSVRPREVELWLNKLSLAPKSKVHIRSMLSQLFEYAMWADLMPTSRNPMSLVTIRSASKRIHKPRVLSVEEFQRLITVLSEPYRTMAILAGCLG